MSFSADQKQLSCARKLCFTCSFWGLWLGRGGTHISLVVTCGLNLSMHKFIFIHVDWWLYEKTGLLGPRLCVSGYIDEISFEEFSKMWSSRISLWEEITENLCSMSLSSYVPLCGYSSPVLILTSLAGSLEIYFCLFWIKSHYTGLRELFARVDMELWIFKKCKERRFDFFVFICILR